MYRASAVVPAAPGRGADEDLEQAAADGLRALRLPGAGRAHRAGQAAEGERGAVTETARAGVQRGPAGDQEPRPVRPAGRVGERDRHRSADPGPGVAHGRRAEHDLPVGRRLAPVDRGQQHRPADRGDREGPHVLAVDLHLGQHGQRDLADGRVAAQLGEDLAGHRSRGVRFAVRGEVGLERLPVQRRGGLQMSQAGPEHRGRAQRGDRQDRAEQRGGDGLAAAAALDRVPDPDQRRGRQPGCRGGLPDGGRCGAGRCGAAGGGRPGSGPGGSRARAPARW